MMGIARALGLNGPALERRGAITAAALGLAAVTAVTAAVFVGSAAQVILAERLPPAVAALVVAGGAALVAVGCLAWARHTMRRTRREVERAVRSSALVTLGRPAVALARRHLGVAGVVVAIGTGFWLARRLPGDGRDGRGS